MKLGLFLGYWGVGPQGDDAVAVTQAAERAGFDSVWAAEAYGSDAVSVLSWLIPQTETIKLGSLIFQIPARPPAAAAMAGCTMDMLSDGRFIFGFGPSGPQVSEGWYGVGFDKPLGRLREYVEIVRRIVAREAPLEYAGEHFTLPLPTPDAKPLKLGFHPLRNEIPVFLGSLGPGATELCGEIADGWSPMFFSIDNYEAVWLPHLEAGLAKAGRARSDLEVSPTLLAAVDGDLDSARAAAKTTLLLYIGGMGSGKKNFYVDLVSRFGFEQEAKEVQRLYLAGQREQAFAAIPDELVDTTTLIGTEAEVAERLESFKALGVDRLTISLAQFYDRAQAIHTIERLGALVGDPAPA